jgi:hypothetical protein
MQSWCGGLDSRIDNGEVLKKEIWFAIQGSVGCCCLEWFTTHFTLEQANFMTQKTHLMTQKTQFTLEQANIMTEKTHFTLSFLSRFETLGALRIFFFFFDLKNMKNSPKKFVDDGSRCCCCQLG